MSGYYYLASPYSRYPAGHDAACHDVCVLAARLMKSGVLVCSPIAHGHAIAEVADVGRDFTAWAALSEALIAGSRGMIVAMMDGWRESTGIAAEIEICKRLGKPVLYMDGDMNLTPEPPR